MAALKGFIEVASRDRFAFSNTRENDLVVFTTSNSQRILIGPGPANITISSNLIDVGGNLNFTGALTQSGAPFQTSRWSSNASGIHIMSNVGIGTNTPGYRLDVSGSINIQNNLYNQNTLLHIAKLSSNLIAGAPEPIIAMTSYNALGYEVQASSEYHEEWAKAFWAFDNSINSMWHSQYAMYNFGIFNNSQITGNYYGEWISLKLPYSMKIVKFSITCSHNLHRAPKTFALFGSTDNFNWTILYNQESPLINWTTREKKTFEIWYPGQYVYYRLAVQSVGDFIAFDSNNTDHIEARNVEITNITYFPEYVILEPTIQGKVFIGNSNYKSSIFATNTFDNLLTFDNIYDNNNSTPANKIRLHTGTANNWISGFGITLCNLNYHSGDNHTFWTGTSNAYYGIERMRILKNGNVGIGTTAPSGRLHVNGGRIFIGDSGKETTSTSMSGANAMSNILVFDNWFDTNTTINASTPANKIRIHTGNNNDWIAGFGISSGSFNYHVGAGHHVFWTSSSSSNYGTERMRITSGGDVGIGTTTPSYRLDVSGGARISSNLDVGLDGTPGIIRLGGPHLDSPYNYAVIANRLYGASDFSELVIFKGNDSGTGAGPDRIRLRAAELVFDTYPSGSEDFTATNPRMVINSSGNVGIGTTSPGHVLDVAGNIRANDIRFTTSGTGLQWDMNTDGAEIKFHSSGDALGLSYLEIRTLDNGDEPIVFTQNTSERMRIHTNGCVGIGTAAPTTRLHVNGEVRATTLTGSLNVTNLSGTVAVGNGGTGTTTSTGSGSVVLNRSATLSGNIHYAGNAQVGQGTSISTFQLGTHNVHETSEGNRVNTNQNGQITCYWLDQSTTVGNGWFQTRGGNSADFTIFMDTTQSDCRINAGNGGRSGGRTLRLQTHGALVEVGGGMSISGTLSKGGGSFDIVHPDPIKAADGYRLRHCFVEAPTRGDNLYTYKVTTTTSNESFTVHLPDYFKHLNENPRVLVSCEEKNVLSKCCATVSSDLSIIEGMAELPATYTIMVIGTRKDQMMREFFDDTGGVEYIAANAT